jgi:hypothetical protein
MGTLIYFYRKTSIVISSHMMSITYVIRRRSVSEIPKEFIEITDGINRFISVACIPDSPRNIIV